MSNLITSKDLTKNGYKNDQIRSLALQVLNKNLKHQSKEFKLSILNDVSVNPDSYTDHEFLEKLAFAFLGGKPKGRPAFFDLTNEPAAFKPFGTQHIGELAMKQMEVALRLPIAQQAALMPDAHVGYGLPIGSVLATNNAVIPYGVGMDIGCRMSLSIFDANELFKDRYEHQIKMALKNYTHFGNNGGLGFKQEHPVLDHALFYSDALLKKLHGKAVRQLGTSGGGNHFVEFGVLELFKDNQLAMPAKKYMALLSHSGSRGLGAAIADTYTKIAMDRCKLPKQAERLAWLDMDSEPGQAYWKSMELAGDYAKACHDQIHHHLSSSLGLETLLKVENHHNFAWTDKTADGKEVIVHRKGATPAHEGELGIIPGSMASPAFLVSGLGNPHALNSASHGAGRAMSRQKAKQTFTLSSLKQKLKQEGITLIGGGVEEQPDAYKDIYEIMQAQKQLVRTEGVFHPGIVRMNKD